MRELVWEQDINQSRWILLDMSRDPERFHTLGDARVRADIDLRDHTYGLFVADPKDPLGDGRWDSFPLDSNYTLEEMKQAIINMCLVGADDGKDELKEGGYE